MIINLIFIIGIPLWLIAVAATVNFDTGFEFGIRDVFGLQNEFINFMFFSIAAAVLIVIGMQLLRKLKRNKKNSALLLATYNIIRVICDYLFWYRDLHNTKGRGRHL